MVGRIAKRRAGSQTPGGTYTHPHMRQWLQKKLGIMDPRNRILVLTDRGVSLRDTVLERDLWTVAWDDVQQIVAFEVDAYVVDQICLGFAVDASGRLHVADEETPGWEALNGELARRFGVVFEQRFCDVAFPPFARNETVLWRRGDAPPHATGALQSGQQ